MSRAKKHEQEENKNNQLGKYELTKEDLFKIEALRKKINDLTNSDINVKKIAHLISQWLK